MRYLTVVSLIMWVGISCSNEEDGPGPTASFSFVSDDEFNAGSNIAFTNSSTDAKEFLWDFGDNTSSTLINPIHVYQDGGRYTITLIASSGNKTSLFQKEIEIFDKIVEDFEFTSNNNFVAPTTITFENTSTGATEYEWDFGDGTTSSEENPEKIYYVPGNFSVSLKAKNGTRVRTKSKVVNVVEVTQNVWEIITSPTFKQSGDVSADMALDSLVKYLEIHNLSSLVANVEVTLFAPSNTAFVNLLATPGFPSDIASLNDQFVSSILSYHVLLGQTTLKEDLEGGAFLYTAYNSPSPEDKIVVNPDGTLRTGSANQSIQIVDENNMATNGVFHVVPSVFIPQSIGTILTPILGTMAGTIYLDADFRYLNDIIEKADDGFVETSLAKKVFTSLYLQTQTQMLPFLLHRMLRFKRFLEVRTLSLLHSVQHRPVSCF
jgi:PKD repeat protein